MSKRYSEQRGGQRKSNLASVKKLISKLSGGDEASLVTDLLLSRFGQKLALDKSATLNNTITTQV
jgi:hypothetical protein